MPCASEEVVILGPIPLRRRSQSTITHETLNRRTYNHPVGEAGIKRHSVLDLLNVFVGKRDVEGFDVSQQMFDLPPADYGEDVRRLLHQVCNRDCSRHE